MKCVDPLCYNFNHNMDMYCDKCIQTEIDSMTDDEILNMYAEGKEWLDNVYSQDDHAKELLDDFKSGWFALMNIVLLARAKK